MAGTSPAKTAASLRLILSHTMEPCPGRAAPDSTPPDAVPAAGTAGRDAA